MSSLRTFDGHNDILGELWRSASTPTPRRFLDCDAVGHLDLPRARVGGLAGGFFAMFTPGPRPEPPPTAASPPRQPTSGERDYGPPPTAQPPIDLETAQRGTDAMLAIARRVEAASAGAVRIVTTCDELERVVAAGVFAMLLHIEGAEAIDPDLQALDRYYALGVRSLGITWSRPNAFGCGVPFWRPGHPDVGPGLTPAGQRLVRACNARGILVDVAHLNLAGFRDVARLSDRPLVSTHSAAHAVAPSSRCLLDEELDAIGRSGGVVGLNFCAIDMRPDGRDDPDVPLSLIAQHARYIADRIGVAHVALGSDFDGATIPHAVGDVTGLPRVIDALRDAGFTPPEIEQIACGNWLRVLRATLAATHPTVYGAVVVAPGGIRSESLKNAAMFSNGLQNA
jgi:membrane dipeptidase